MATPARFRSSPAVRANGRAPAKGRKPITQPSSSDASRNRSVSSANRWRDQYNPLRGLTIQQVASLCDRFDRGEFADLQWAYRAAERADETLFALVARRLSAIREMDWTIKTVDDHLAGFDASLAEDQRSALISAYNAIDNLYGVIAHLARSVFRGFSIVEKVITETGTWRLLPVEHWNVIRDGTAGGWKYNPEAMAVTYSTLPDSQIIDPQYFIIVVEPDGHLDRLGLVKYVRGALGIKDWTGFIETYAIPSGIVIMPPNVPEGEESKFQTAAENIAGGAPGALPFGSEYKPNDQPRGVNPFTDYLDRIDRQLVLAGTGGMLTMLTESGSGTLAGGAHTDTFRAIARAHGRQISEYLQKQFDADVLAAAFPGQPTLAYFTLEFTVQPETDTIVDHAIKLAAAGWRMSAEELSERTGYKLTEASVPPPIDDSTDQTGGHGAEALLNGDRQGHPFLGNQYQTSLDAILKRAADPAVSDAALLMDITRIVDAHAAQG